MRGRPSPRLHPLQSPRSQGRARPHAVTRADARACAGGRAPLSDPLLSSVAESLLDRLDDVTRSFPRALFVGAPAAYCVARLRGRGGVELGASAALTDGDSDAFRYAARLAGGPGAGADGFAVLSGGEEALADRTLLPDASHDLVVACMGLHWANDLVAAVAHCRRILRPDGLFLAALLGGETLCELRAACALAEMEREGGVSARVSPMVRVRDGGNLLGAAGMALAAVDVDAVKFRYADAAGLVEHLRAIGETAAASARRGALPRDTALAAAAIYAADQAEADGVHGETTRARGGGGRRGRG